MLIFFAVQCGWPASSIASGMLVLQGPNHARTCETGVRSKRPLAKLTSLSSLDSVQKSEGSKTDGSRDATVYELQVGYFYGATGRLPHVRLDECRHPRSFFDDHTLRRGILGPIDLGEHQPTEFDLM